MQDAEGRDGDASGKDVALAGLNVRLAPMLAGTIALIALLLPVVFIGNVSGLEILVPIATVTIGGTIISLLYSLLALPSLYAAWRSTDGDEVGEAMAQA